MSLSWLKYRLKIVSNMLSSAPPPIAWGLSIKWLSSASRNNDISFGYCPTSLCRRVCLEFGGIKIEDFTMEQLCSQLWFPQRVLKVARNRAQSLVLLNQNWASLLQCQTRIYIQWRINIKDLKFHQKRNSTINIRRSYILYKSKYYICMVFSFQL